MWFAPYRTVTLRTGGSALPCCSAVLTCALRARSLRIRQVQELEADAVDAESRERGSIDLGIVVRRQQRRTCSPAGEIDTPEPNPLAVGGGEVSTGDADEAVFAGGSIKEEPDVGRRGGGDEVVDRKFGERRTLSSLLRESRSKGEQEREQAGGHFHRQHSYHPRRA